MWRGGEEQNDKAEAPRSTRFYVMSGGQACHCSEKNEPLEGNSRGNYPLRLWRVVDRECNYSTFNGRQQTYSQFSAITCLKCGARWRTRATYVQKLPDLNRETEFNTSPGISSYQAAMVSFGREPYKNGDR